MSDRRRAVRVSGIVAKALRRGRTLGRAVSEVLERRVLMTGLPGGTVDPSFAGGGSPLPVPGLPGASGRVVAMTGAIQLGRQYVLTETAFRESGPPYVGGGGLVVTRVNADGSMDTTWGVSGRFVFSTGLGVTPAGIDVDSLGRVLITGTLFKPAVVGGATVPEGDAMVMRLSSGGALDTSFGTGGWQTYDLNGSGSDDAVIAGSTFGNETTLLARSTAAGGGTTRTAVLKVGLSGSPVMTWGTSGVALVPEATDFSPAITAQAMVTRDGISGTSAQVLIVGTDGAGAGLRVLGLDATGGLSSGFGTGGMLSVTVPAGMTGVGLFREDLGADRKYYALAEASGQAVDFTVAAIAPATGQLDGSYATGGVFNYRDALGTDASSGTMSTASIQAVSLATLTYGVTVVMGLRNDLAPNPAETTNAAAFQLTEGGAKAWAATSGIVLRAEASVLGRPVSPTDNPLPVVGAGRVTAASTAGTPSTPVTSEATSLVQWLSTGATPGDFGTSGVADLPEIAGNMSWSGQAVAADPDGSVVVAGLSVNTAGQQVVVLRKYARDGLQAWAVGLGAGRLTSLVEVAGVVRQPDGKYLVAFSGRDSGGGSFTGTPLLVMRVEAGGSLDTSFGSGGIVSLTPAGDVFYTARAATLSPAGEAMLISGTVADGASRFVTKVRFDGTVDPAFGVAGVRAVTGPAADSSWDAIATDPATGKIVLTGWFGPLVTSAQVLVERLNGDGSIDTTFGAGGRVLFAVPAVAASYGMSVALAPDGRVYVGGRYLESDGDEGWFVAARASNGAEETSFGDAGQAVSMASFDSRVTGLVPSTGAGGGVVALGSWDGRAFIRRFNVNGGVDGGYANSIAPTLQFGGYNAVTTDKAGRIVAAGDTTGLGGFNLPATVSRLLPESLSAPQVAKLTTFAPGYGTSALRFQVVLRAGVPGLRLNDSSLPSAFLVQRPDGSLGSASLEGFTSVESGLELVANYRFDAPGGTFGVGNNGTYSIVLQAGVLQDEVGNTPSANTTVGSVVVAVPGGIGLPGDPDGSFAFGGISGPYAGTLTGGRVVQVLERGDGRTYVLYDLATDLPAPTAGGGLVLRRLLANGSEDPTFGDNGTVQFNVGLGVSGAKLIDAGPGAGFYVVGTAFRPSAVGATSFANGDLLVLRVDELGRVVTSFNAGLGYRLYDLDVDGDSFDVAYSAGRDASGNVTILASSREDGAAPVRLSYLRVDAVGTPVAGFGGGAGGVIDGAFVDTTAGTFNYATTPQSLAVRGDGAFFTVGDVSNVLSVRAYTSSGAVAGGFGTAGTALAPVSLPAGGNGAQAVLIDSAGRVLAGGVSDLGDAVLAARNATTGALEATYGTNGTTSYNQHYPAEPSGLEFSDVSFSMDGAGRVVFAGRGLTGTSVAAVRVGRYLPGGGRDFTFNGGQAAGLGAFVTTPAAPISVSATVGRIALVAPFESGSYQGSYPLGLYALDGTGNNTAPGFNSSTPLQLGLLFPAGATAAVRAVANGPSGKSLVVFTSTDPVTGRETIGTRLLHSFGQPVGPDVTDSTRWTNLKVAGVYYDAGAFRYRVVFTAADANMGTGQSVVVFTSIRTDGTRDNSFGSGGYLVHSPAGSNSVFAAALAVSPVTGRVFLAGRVGTSAAMFGYNSDGTPAILSGVTQISVQDSDFANAVFSAVTVDPVTGAVIAAVTSTTGGGEIDPTLAVSRLKRYTNDLFTSGFGVSAFIDVTPVSAATSHAARGLLVDGGRLVVAGQYGLNTGRVGAFATAYLLADGSVDATFNSGTPHTSPGTGAYDGMFGVAKDTSVNSGYVLAGAVAGSPKVWRLLQSGTFDGNYAVNYPVESAGSHTGLVMDPAGRAMVFGEATPPATTPRSGFVRRLNPTASTTPVLVSADASPAPVATDTVARIRVTVRAAVGLTIDPTTLAGAVRYSRPSGPAALGTLVASNSPDGGRTWVLDYTYTPVGANFGPASGGAYVFRLIGGAVRDELGIPLNPSDQTIATVNVPTVSAPATGLPDVRWDGDGKQTGAMAGAPGEPVQVLRRGDGFIYVLSNLPRASTEQGWGPNAGFVVTRLDSTGVVTPGWGVQGRLVFSVGTGATASALLDDGAGGFFVAGTAWRAVVPGTAPNGAGLTGDYLVVKLTAAGTLDTSSGGFSVATFDPSGLGLSDRLSSAVRTADGGVVLIGRTAFGGPEVTSVMKMTAAGSADTGFEDAANDYPSGPGSVIPGFVVADSPQAAAVDASGAIYFTGASNSGGNLMVVKRAADGSVVNAFGTGGEVSIALGTDVAEGRSVTVTSGRLYVAGITGGPIDAFVTALDPADGSTQTAFNTTGVYRYNLTHGTTLRFFDVRGAVRASDGAFVLAGTTETASLTRRVTVSVRTATGAADTVFNSGQPAQLGLLDPISNRPPVLSVETGTILAGTATLDPAGTSFAGVLTMLDPVSSVVPTFTGGGAVPGFAELPLTASAGVSTAVGTATDPASGNVFSAELSFDPVLGVRLGASLSDRLGQVSSSVVVQVKDVGNGPETASGAGVIRMGTKWVVYLSVLDPDNLFPQIHSFRFNADGTLDTTYGSGTGRVVSEPFTGVTAPTVRAVTTNAAGTLAYLTGSRQGKPFVAVYLPNGLPLTDINGTGFSPVPAAPFGGAGLSIAVVGSGPGLSVLVGGRVGSTARGVGDTPVVFRFSGPTMAFDTNFGSQGFLNIDVPAGLFDGEVLSIAPDSLARSSGGTQGRLYAGGSLGDAGNGRDRWFVYGYDLAAGAPAAGFAGSQGSMVMGTGDSFLAGVYGLGVDLSDSGVIAAGSDGGRPMLIRLRADGSRDLAYNSGTGNATNFGRYTGLTLDVGGRAIAFGQSGLVTEGAFRSVVDRYTTSIPGAPTSSNVSVSTPVPTFSGTTARVTVVFTASAGQKIDRSTLPGLIRYTRSGSGVAPVAATYISGASSDSDRTVTATYEFEPVGGLAFGLASGSYVFSIAAGQLADLGGNVTTGGVNLNTLTVSFTPPTTTVTPPPAPTPGQGPVSISVTYTPAAGRSIDNGSISAANLDVTLNGQPFGTLSVGSVTAGANGSVVVTYVLTPPGGTFDPSEQGALAFAVSPELAVTDDAGVPVAAGTLATVNVQFASVVTATIGPVATPRFGSTSLTFTVTYNADTGRTLDAASLSSSVIVAGFAGGTAANAVATSVAGSGQSATVTYVLTPPGGTFDFAEAGGLTLATPAAGGAGSVRDDLNASPEPQPLTAVPLPYEAVTVQLSPGQRPRVGDTSFDVVATFTAAPGRAIDGTTVAGAPFTVAGPGGLSVQLAPVSVAGAGGVRFVTYRFTAPGGTFDVADAGTYMFTAGAVGGVTDDLGVPALASVTTTLVLDYLPVVPSLVPPATPRLGTASALIRVTYTAGVGKTLDASTFGGAVIDVTTPSGAVVRVGSPSVASTGSRTVTLSFVLPAPGGTWGAEDAGAYGVTVPAGTVADLDGVTATAGSVGGFPIAYVPPTAVLAPPVIPQAGSGTAVFTVVYTASAGRTLDGATLSASAVSVATPSGAVVRVAAGSVVNSGATASVTYALPAPGGAWGAEDAGTYTVSLETAPTDDVGVASDAAGLGSLAVAYPPMGASLALPAVPRVGAGSLSFVVTYTAGAGRSVDVASLTGARVTVTLPGGGVTTLLPDSTSGTGNSVQATYTLPAPGGTFGPEDVGDYIFAVKADASVSDDLGTRLVPAGLGTLSVQYTAPSASFVAAAPVRFGAAFIEATVDLAPALNATLDLSTVDGDEVAFRRPDGSTGVATLASLSVTASGARAVYRIAAPVGGFGTADVGDYRLSLVAGTFNDDRGVPNLTADPLATVTLAFPPATAGGFVAATPVPGDTAATGSFRIVPAPGRTIDATTVGAGDVLVTRPDFSVAPATITSVTGDPDGSVVVAFSFSPVSGVFDDAAGGIYVVSLAGGSYTDDLGVPGSGGEVGRVTFVATAKPGEVVSLTLPGGSFLPGENIFPTVRVSNPSVIASTPFTVRFFVQVGTALVPVNDLAVDPLAAGATLDLTPPAGVPLLGTDGAPLAPGSYTLAAQILDQDGVAIGLPVLGTPAAVVTPVPETTPGSLDPDFGGGDGVVTTFVPGPRITIVGSVALPGQLLLSGGYNEAGDFLLARFLADGSLDATFGTDGLITVDLGGTDIASTFTADAQGRVLLGGTTRLGDRTRFAIVRFNVNGTLDTTFGTAGKLVYAPDGADASLLRSVTPDRFGRPYLLGSVVARQRPDGPLAPQGLVVRLSPTGVVDTAFGSRGVISAAFTDGAPGVLQLGGDTSELTSLRLLSDRIVVGGYSGAVAGATRFVVAGLGYDGTPDKRFGTAGLFLGEAGTTADRVTTLLETPDGRSIYVAGSRGNVAGTSSQAVVFRLDSRGRADRGFNAGQPRTLLTGTPLGTVTSLLNSVNNTILATVATAASPALAAAGQVGVTAFRLTAAGQNDPFFNGGQPLVIFDAGVVPAAASDAVTGAFDQFVQSKQGAGVVVDGGAIRAVASRAADGQGTALSVAQLSPDGADLRPILAATIPASVRPGYRGTARVSVSNVGSLTANGRFSVNFVADGVNDVAIPTSVLSGRIAPGSTRTFTVRFTLPKTTPDGTYQLGMTLAPVAGFTDINSQNNGTSRPEPFAVSSGTTPAPASVVTLTPAQSGLRSFFSDREVDPLLA